MNTLFKRYVCIKQHDLKDCGCACLATITKQYGYKTSISKIREVAGTDKHGTSALGIINAAEQLGFSAKGVKANKKEDLFSEIPLPAIAHVVIDGSLLHYVVIHKITKKEIIVADPGKGIVNYSPEEFFKVWTNILIIITPNASFKKGDDTNGLYKRFISLIVPQKKLFINIFVVSILLTILGIIGSFYFKFLMDDILPSSLNKTLQVVSIGAIILSVFKVLLEAFRTQLLIYLSQNINIPLMLGYYDHVIKLPMNFFETREVGEIISRFNDASRIREAVSGATLTMMIDSFMVLVGGIILFNQSHLLFGFSIVPIVLYIIVVLLFKKPLDKVNRKTMEDNAKLTSYMVESFNGIETIKVFNAERKVIFDMEQKFIKLTKSIFNNGFISNIQNYIKGTIKSIFSIAILWIGINEVFNGHLSIGELLTFNALLIYFIDPIERIINLQQLVQTAVIAADRLGEIIDLNQEKSQNEESKIKPNTLKGDIIFKNVNFRFGSRKLVLKRINMIIKEGEKVALIGESGSGKTTLTKLLLKLHQCQDGDIIINGYNINDINIECLRDKIAYISQNAFFFSGTIRENLIFSNEEATFEEVIDACKKSQIHDYINSLPLRYDTLLEENASNISGGQKQRLAIARALLKKPEILIMDEATSNLDSITEKAIENTINEFSKDITTILIAHRLSTIKRCDKIYVLDKGEIIESGLHNELINKHGIYSKLWKEQFPELVYLDEVASCKELEEFIK